MKNLAIAALALLLLSGCGSNPSATGPTKTVGNSGSTSTAVSMWDGSYTGTLNLKGCQTVGACSGDQVTMQITQTASGSSFSSSLLIKETNVTLNQVLAWSGKAVYTGAAPAGPGTQDTTATMTTSTGQTILVSGVGSSSTTDPVLMQSLSVYNYPMTNGVGSKGAYLGTLTRK